MMHYLWLVHTSIREFVHHAYPVSKTAHKLKPTALHFLQHFESISSFWFTFDDFLIKKIQLYFLFYEEHQPSVALDTGHKKPRLNRESPSPYQLKINKTKKKQRYSWFYWPFQCGTSFVDLLCFCSVLCLLCLCARLFICALWSPAGKGLTSWLSFVVSNCEFVTFPLVSWVRCGTWLYRFLIFAPLLTLNPLWQNFLDPRMIDLSSMLMPQSQEIYKN